MLQTEQQLFTLLTLNGNQRAILKCGPNLKHLDKHIKVPAAEESYTPVTPYLKDLEALFKEKFLAFQVLANLKSILIPS